MEDKTIIEVNGIKLEVDLRTARRVEEYRVGDTIKVLVKVYGDSFNSYPGVIIGFDMFKERPSINIAYLDMQYSECKLVFIFLTKDSKDIEICHVDDEVMKFSKARILEILDNEILKKEQDLKESAQKKDYFLEHFNQFFNSESEIEEQVNAVGK